MSDDHTLELVEKVADELKPHFQTLLKKARSTENDAYSLAYGRAVAQVAKANHTTEAKAKFDFRHVLQDIMSRVTT